MLFQFIIKILFRKDVEFMAVIYATLIIKGKKTFADVPEKIKDKVKEVLIDLDCPELAE
ncbi:MAG: CD1375 family protein [Lachnospiraceae bacterium]|nr:MAG: CD1375 family protein [Lachnospiraceae bacterium]